MPPHHHDGNLEAPPVTDEGGAVGSEFDSDTATGMMPMATTLRAC